MTELEISIITEAKKMKKSGLTFRQISEKLNISLSEVVHFITDLKYKDI